MMRTSNRLRLSLIGACALSFVAAACSDTWQGVKEDTRDNVKSTGQGIENAGENIQKKVD